MELKIVIIGGGSSYTPEIIEGIIRRHKSFPVTEIVLVDIEEGKEKLSIIGKLSKRMVKKAKKPIHISWTLDHKKALINAAFVSIQIRVGGLKAREKDEKIPLSHGLIGQETNGAGGIFKAFRTIPVLMKLAQDIHEICPSAWIINFTNPAGIITEALLKYSSHKRIIGVCNIPYNMRYSTAEILNENPKDVEIEFIGMNHFIFGSKVIVRGEDRTEEVLERLFTEGASYLPANIINLGWSKPFINALKMMPNPYHQYYFQTRDILEQDIKSYNENETRSKVVQELEKSLFERYKDVKLCVKPKELEKRGGAFYSDVACSLMDSIFNNKQDIQTVNVMNNGTISDLPRETVIETNCIITKDGPIPITIGRLPDQIKAFILQMQVSGELIIRASFSGKYNDAYIALLSNPLVADERLSKVVLDELLEAHHFYLPQFNPKGG